jgi:hypothetical protein
VLIFLVAWRHQRSFRRQAQRNCRRRCRPRSRGSLPRFPSFSPPWRRRGARSPSVRPLEPRALCRGPRVIAPRGAVRGIGCPLWPWRHSSGRTTPTTGRQLGRPPSRQRGTSCLPHCKKRFSYRRDPTFARSPGLIVRGVNGFISVTDPSRLSRRVPSTAAVSLGRKTGPTYSARLPNAFQEIAPTPFHPITPNFFRNAFRSLNRSLASFCSSGSLSNTNLCGEPLVMTNILTGRS